jgi:hypothetical protein
MAIYHFHAKTVSRSQGHSAVAAAAYRAGEKLFDQRRERTHDYRPRAGGAAEEPSAVAAAAYRAGATLFDARREQVYDYSPRSRVVTSVILTPPQAPAWMAERETLWNTCEAIEKRKDSCVAREIEVALPRELSLAAGLALVTGFVREQLTPRGVVADVAIHQGPARDGGMNPHAHILFTPRPVLKDGSGFGKKDRGLERRETLRQWRQAWQDHVNRALEEAGAAARVDHRTLKDQGSARRPDPTVTRRVLAMEERGLDTVHGARWRAERHANGLLADTPLEDPAAFLAAAARMTPAQSRTHQLLTLASRALTGQKG